MTTGTDVRPTGTSATPRSPLTFDDLAADLVWPKLLRAPALGLSPSRMIVAFLALVAVMAVMNVGLWLDARVKGETTPARWAEVVSQVRSDQQMAWPKVHKATVPWRWAVRFPAQMVRQFPLTSLLFVPFSLIIALTLLGAISRMTACEFAQGVSLSWPQGLAFAVSHWKSLVGAVVLPIGLVWLIALGIAAAGAVLLSFPVVNLVGGVVYGLLSAAGLVAMLVLAGYILGHHLLLPAVACDGCDAIDAINRAYAYVLGRPLRLILYVAITAAAVVAAVIVAMVIATVAVGFTFEAASAWAGPSARSSLWDAIVSAITSIRQPQVDREAAGVTGTFVATAGMVRMWMILALLLVWVYAISAATSGCTLVYLLLRRVNDGQDTSEIWMPGMVEGTMAKATAVA